MIKDPDASIRGSDDLEPLVLTALRGAMGRREVFRRLIGCGLAAPAATMLMAQAGLASAQTSRTSPSGPRGGAGTLKAVFWQGATLLNPHLSVNTKDREAARIFYEPLASWDDEGRLVPILAAEIPSRGNGGLQDDGRSVTWRLKRDVLWHDGRPFGADDCVFTWEYARDPGTGAATLDTYKGVTVERLDSHTIRVRFTKPTPFWAAVFVGPNGAILPKHLFGGFTGARARENPAHTSPIGTGPYRFAEFRPGEWLRATINGRYHMAGLPHFDAIEIRGGGDAVGAARLVLQTGECDYAWNLNVEDAVLSRMETAGRGRLDFRSGALQEVLQLNPTDPWNEVDGERSSARSRHFAFDDPRVRRAVSLLIDRRQLQATVWGRTGEPTSNVLNGPAPYRSGTTRIEFDPAQANGLLEAAGWRLGADGFRSQQGRRLRLVLQTSVNAARQNTQAFIRTSLARSGIEVETRSISPAVFFGGDSANPDSYAKFWSDMQMYTTTTVEPDPARAMESYVSWEIASRANGWSGRNVSRFANPEFDRLYRTAEVELDPARRAELFIRMNDLLVRECVVIPLVRRPRITALAQKLTAELSAWDLDLSSLHGWGRGDTSVMAASVTREPVVVAAAPAATVVAAPAPAPEPPPQPQPAPAQATAVPRGRRVALVIGNARYDDRPLRNPLNDATDMGSALQRLGFAVQTATDLGRSQMLQSIRRFGETAAGAEAALFYFAGHGVQIRGKNYLLPVGQRFNDEPDVEADAIEVATVLRRLEEAAPRVAVVVLDACRSPILVGSTRNMARGLARVDAPSGALVAFAAQPGSEAQDGTGRNGVYTAALLRHLATPDITVEQVFKRVRADVEKATGGRQSPREESSLKGDDFYFSATR